MDVFCSSGQKCNLIKQTYKDSDDKDITEFNCKICEKKGKYEEGAYVCA